MCAFQGHFNPQSDKDTSREGYEIKCVDYAVYWSLNLNITFVFEQQINITTNIAMCSIVVKFLL